MDTEIRSLSKEESSVHLDSIYKLNQENTPEVGCLDNIDHLKRLISMSAIVIIASVEKRIVGFMICMSEDSEYASKNYLFFLRKYSSFTYIDRIAINNKFRNFGLGSKIYRYLQMQRSTRNKVCCEVNIKPLNQPSLNFHQKHGFVSVGEKTFEDGHAVRYLSNEFFKT